ncbi:MAG TPA: hypothetical protein VGH25_05430, partial [Dongiaceae bacterium]
AMPEGRSSESGLEDFLGRDEGAKRPESGIDATSGAGAAPMVSFGMSAGMRAAIVTPARGVTGEAKA